MKSASLRSLVLGISITLGVVAPTYGYAPLGHEIVGAIADERLANTPTAAKIRALIGGLSLEKAAVLADILRRDERGKIAYSSVLEFTDKATRDAFSDRVIAALLAFAPATFDSEDAA